jgi:hypothetical protein
MNDTELLREINGNIFSIKWTLVAIWIVEFIRLILH